MNDQQILQIAEAIRSGAKFYWTSDDINFKKVIGYSESADPDKTGISCEVLYFYGGGHVDLYGCEPDQFRIARMFKFRTFEG